MKCSIYSIIGALSLSSLFASPTSLFWTNCTTDVVEEKTYHLEVDNYGTSFKPDIGLTLGLPASQGFSGEVGTDYVKGAKQALSFNGKLRFADNPSIAIGIFNVGTNQGVIDAVIETCLPGGLGRLFIGLFHGKRALGKQRSGWMVDYQKGFCHKKEEGLPEYDSWQFCADYASGKNSIGGGGFGFAYFFTHAMSIKTGPVWFNDTKLNGRWKWALQLGIDF